MEMGNYPENFRNDWTYDQDISTKYQARTYFSIYSGIQDQKQFEHSSVSLKTAG